VVKTREIKEDGSEGWHWRYYLPGDDCDRGLHRPSRNWGGGDWITSPYSKQLIRDEVRKGDLVVCYQTDGREILGFTRMVSDGKQDSPGSGDYNCFDLAPPRESFVLDPPLSIPELYDTGCYPKCFALGGQGTVFPVQPSELSGIVNAIRLHSPQQGNKLRAWFTKWGYNVARARRPARA
jgi:hypothetical protein